MGDSSPSAENKRILLVEDEPFVRESLEMILASQGWQVTSFARGDEVIGALDRLSYRLAIVDSFLPGMDGAEVARHLKKHSNAPVFMLTGCTSPNTADRAMSAGVDRVLHKPIPVSALFEALEQFESTP